MLPAEVAPAFSRSHIPKDANWDINGVRNKSGLISIFNCFTLI